MQTENIMQQAQYALDYWEEDSMWARLIERDIDSNDLEALQFHVDEANALMNMQEDFSRDFEKRLLSDKEEDLIRIDWPVVPTPEGFGECGA